MKPFTKVAIVGVVIALVVYACSPSNYSEKSALLKLEKALGYKVNATHTSALGYAVKVGGSYTQYFKVKCDLSETHRLVKTMGLATNYEDYNDMSEGDTPGWFAPPESSSIIYGQYDFKKADFGSSIKMWNRYGYLYVKVSFWD